MKKLIFLFILSATLVQAQMQMHRFIYEYKYIPDSTQKDTIRKDMMALDITDKGSTYQSLTKMAGDSIRRAEIQKMISSGGARNGASFNLRNTRKAGTVDYKINKEYPSFRTFLTERIGRDNYKVLEEEKIIWAISPEQKTFGAYTGQKATTTWGGRKWIAYFSTDIPFQDGPYKFSGLPGLIINIEDETGSHKMTLIGNKTISAANTSDESTINGATVRFGGMKEIEVSEAQFKKAYANYLLDPSKDFRGMGQSGDGMFRTSYILKGADGKDIDPKQMARKMEQNAKEKIKHDNNKIEPTLYNAK